MWFPRVNGLKSRHTICYGPQNAIEILASPVRIRVPFWHVTHECLSRVGCRACRPTTGEKGASAPHTDPQERLNRGCETWQGQNTRGKGGPPVHCVKHKVDEPIPASHLQEGRQGRHEVPEGRLTLDRGQKWTASGPHPIVVHMYAGGSP